MIVVCFASFPLLPPLLLTFQIFLSAAFGNQCIVQGGVHEGVILNYTCYFLLQPPLYCIAGKLPLHHSLLFLSHQFRVQSTSILEKLCLPLVPVAVSWNLANLV